MPIFTNKSNGVHIHASPESTLQLYTTIGTEETDLFRLPAAISQKSLEKQGQLALHMRIGSTFTLSFVLSSSENEEPLLRISANYRHMSPERRESYKRATIYEGTLSDIIPPLNANRRTSTTTDALDTLLCRLMEDGPTNALSNSFPVMPGIDSAEFNVAVEGSEEEEAVEDEDTEDGYEET